MGCRHNQKVFGTNVRGVGVGPKWVVDTLWVDCFNTQPSMLRCSYTTNREMKSCEGGNRMQRISLPNERDKDTIA